MSSAVYRTICFLPVSAIFAGRYYVSAGKKYFMPVSAICAAETGFCRQKANPAHNNYGLLRTTQDLKRLESQGCLHRTTVTDKTAMDLSLEAKD